MVLQRGGLQRFHQQVGLAGDSLAKLNFSPDAIAAALQQYDALLETALERGGFEVPRLTLERLHATVILSLSNAYHLVREAETKAFHDIFQIELEAHDTETLFARFLEVMSSSCGAVEARLFLLSEDAPPKTPVSSPLYIKKGTRQERYLLDADWRGVHQCYWSIPLLSGPLLLGVIQFGFAADRRWLPREEELLTTAAHWCMRAARKVRLLEDLARSKEEIRRLGGKMLELEELERRRISRELHDEPGQSLVVIRLQLELIELALPPEADEFRGQLAEIRKITEKTIRDIRRLISDLSPAILEQLGLAAALRQMINRFRRVHPAHIRLKVSKTNNISKNLELIAYRLIQESCNNIVKHSSAANVNISVTSAEGVLRLLIEDDGVSLDSGEGATEKPSLGLPGIRERVALFGGKFNCLRSKKRGTQIEIELPIRSEK
jgi:signal transduction histidine kinase